MGSSHPDPRIAAISASIRAIPDFPKKGCNGPGTPYFLFSSRIPGACRNTGHPCHPSGILFRDVTTLLLDHKAFQNTIDIFVERYKNMNIDVVVGIEARGFIFGPPIALALGAKFVPQRKPKKLPGEVVRQEYALEYGTDCIEMHVGAVLAGEKCLLVDDLIATGGTLAAGIKLLERVGAEVVECACVIELSDLKGREKLGDKPVFVLVDYEGE